MVHLKIAIPNKGRLLDDTLSIMKRAGLGVRSSDPRQLSAPTVRSEFSVIRLRTTDIPNFVAKKVAQVGITGLDIVEEMGDDLEVVVPFDFGGCKLVVAVPEDSGWSSVADLPDSFSVATSFPSLTERFFTKNGKTVEVVTVDGACEAAPSMGIASVIVDLVSSGKTLMMNRLKVIDTVLESSAVLVAPKDLGAEERVRVDELAEAFSSVMRARTKRYLLANVPRSALDEIRSFLPGLNGPTVVDILDHPDKVAIHVAIDEKEIYESVIRLKQLGGEGILILPVDRMVA